MSDERKVTTERRSAWLIEAVGPHYLAVTELGHRFCWVTHVDWALQLATEAQANALRDAARELRQDLFPDCYPMPKATEHLWMGTESDAVTTLQSELEKTRWERDAALERARNAEAQADASAIYNATTQKNHPGAHVMVIDEYQRANLLWLFRQCGYPYQEGASQFPFNTGDWLGELAIKAGMDRPPEHKPNAPEGRGAKWLAERDASFHAAVERLTKERDEQREGWANELGAISDAVGHPRFSPEPLICAVERLTAELARLRPVVEAAKRWRGYDRRFEYDRELRDAIAALAPVPKAGEDFIDTEHGERPEPDCQPQEGSGT